METRILQSGRVLIIDDLEGNVRLLERILASAGYTHIRSLTDPRKVTTLYQEWDPDLILLDLMMPHLDGFEVMKQLQPLIPPGSYLPILAITADASPEVRQRALSEGAKDFLNKPIDRAEVLVRIANLLETRFLHLKIKDHNNTLEEIVRQRTIEVREQASLIAKARDAIFVHDLQGEITFWNAGAERLYGWARTEAVGMPAPQLLEMSSSEVLAARGATLANEEWTGELHQTAKDGKQVIVLSRWSLVRDECDEPKSILVMNTDVTKKKSLEAQLQHAQRMEGIGMLAGGVAHDFNNLLTVINGYSEIAIGRINPTDPLHDMIKQVYLAGERAAKLTRQLLAFSREQIPQVEVLDLNDVVLDAEMILSRLIGEGVTIETEAGPQLGRIKADSGQIEQILLNLCVNARDAMPHGGRITITTRNVELDEAYTREHPYVRPGRYVLMSVRDRGEGMDDATRIRIFEPFFTTKEVGKGTGFGLATVYGIIKQNGGSIEVESKPGSGTTFRMFLPRVDDVVPESSVEDTKAPHGTETLLLVDDEFEVRALIRLVLSAFGYQVLDAADGASALLLSGAHKAPIQLLITDVVMPGMSGRELADRLKGQRPGIKTLYISGYTNDAIIRNGVTAGDASFLAKPITPRMLARKVRLILDQSDEVA